MSLHHNSDFSKVAYADTNLGFTMETGLSIKSESKNKPAGKPTKSVEQDPATASIDNVAFWGEDNLFPQNLLEDVKDSTVVLPIIEKQVAALYGGGFEYGHLVYESGQEPRFDYIIDPEIEDFIEASNLLLYLRDAIHDFYFLRNFFPEIILTKNRKRICFLSALDGSWCRWEERKPKELASKHLLFNPEWGFQTEKSKSQKVKVLDPGFMPVDNLRNRKDAFKYVYPLSWTKRGRSYYSLSSWDGMRAGWLKTTLHIPTFKDALMKHQTTIKYHIVVKDKYWEWKYPGFIDMKPEKRKKCIEQEAKYWKDTLTDSKNAGKNIMTTDIWNDVTQTYDVGVQVTAVDNKIKDGIYIEDSQEAVAHIAMAMGWDTSIVGRGPGKNNNSSGSGSDKAAALQNYLALTQPHRDLILAPMHFIASYNGWKKRLNEINPKGISKKLHFRFKAPMTATKVIDGKELKNET